MGGGGEGSDQAGRGRDGEGGTSVRGRLWDEDSVAQHGGVDDREDWQGRGRAGGRPSGMSAGRCPAGVRGRGSAS